jgi:hypothetical protein
MYGYDLDAYVDMTLGVTEAMSQASAGYDLLMEQLDQQPDTRAAKLPENGTEAERRLIGVTEAMSQASAGYDLLMEQLDQQPDTRAAKLPENGTEAERLLAAVWDYEARSPRKSSLQKWLFALTLSGTVLSAYGPSDVYTAVKAAITPSQEKPTVDAIAAATVEEDIDYRVAQHGKSLAGWRAFLDAHPDGPHAQAVQAEIERLMPAQPPQPVEVGEQSLPPPAQTTLVEIAPQPPASPPAMVEKEPARPPVQIVESPPAPTPEPAMVEEEQAPPPVQIAESPPAPALQPVMVMREPAPPPIPVFAPPVFAPVEAAESTPLPRSRPREIAVAKSVEPAHQGPRRNEHYAARRLQEYATLSGRYRTEYRTQASQTDVFAVLSAQLFHPHHRRWTSTGGGA